MTTQQMVELAMLVNAAEAQQAVAMEVLGAGTAAMLEGGAHPWEVALATYYFDRYMFH